MKRREFIVGVSAAAVAAAAGVKVSMPNPELDWDGGPLLLTCQSDPSKNGVYRVDHEKWIRITGTETISWIKPGDPRTVVFTVV